MGMRLADADAFALLVRAGVAADGLGELGELSDAAEARREGREAELRSASLAEGRRGLVRALGRAVLTEELAERYAHSVPFSPTRGAVRPTARACRSLRRP